MTDVDFNNIECPKHIILIINVKYIFITSLEKTNRREIAEKYISKIDLMLH